MGRKFLTTPNVNGVDVALVNHTHSNLAPTGAIVMYGGSTAPSGWLLCDGSAVSRTTYANLFAVIGTAFGVGDNSTTFNLPDLRERFPLGWKAAGAVGGTLGAAGGTLSHTHDSHSFTQPSSHSHSGGAVGTGGAHTHNVPQTSGTALDVGGTGSNAARYAHTHTADSAGDHSHTFTQPSSHTHSGGAVSPTTHSAQDPPFQVVNFIIRT